MLNAKSQLNLRNTNNKPLWFAIHKFMNKESLKTKGLRINKKSIEQRDAKRKKKKKTWKPKTKNEK